ncbi:MAG TPA: hypothetical protein VHB79_12045 [Polyangiaceae bacterium]|nr:hypothetical protein [Polyangiaceae bacterium]
MKVGKVREHYVAQTTKASEVSRQLALAGIGVVWVVKGSGQIGPFSAAAIGAFVIALAFDLTQYSIAARAWETEADKVSELEDDDFHTVTSDLNHGPRNLFALKIVAVGLGYLCSLLGGLAGS